MKKRIATFALLSMLVWRPAPHSRNPAHSPREWLVLNAVSGAGGGTVTGGTNSCSAGFIQTGTTISTTGVPTAICTQKTEPFVCGTISAPSNSQVLCDIPITKAETIPSSCTNSQAVSTVAATGTATFTINKISGGVTTAAGTVAWSGAGKTGAFTCSGSTSFAAGDMLQVVSPGTADATLAGLGITISMNAGAL